MQNQTPRTSNKPQNQKKSRKQSDTYRSVDSHETASTSLAESASRVRDKAAQASERVAASYDETTTNVGKKLAHAGHALEDSDVVNRAAQGLTKVGKALENTNAAELQSYARRMVREHPLAAVGTAVGLGVLLARLTR